MFVIRNSFTSEPSEQCLGVKILLETVNFKQQLGLVSLKLYVFISSYLMEVVLDYALG